MCSKMELSDRWSEEAYRRQPTWVSAYNLALAKETDGKPDEAFDLFKEAHQLDPRQPVVLHVLGKRLIVRGKEEEGEKMLRRALDLIYAQLLHGDFDESDIALAKNLIERFDDRKAEKALEEFERSHKKRSTAFSEGSLAASEIVNIVND